MKYWDEEFVETRDIYEGEFRSPIVTPALRGKILNNNDVVVGLYELEIVKEPCSVTKRIDATSFESVEDMCVMFDFRLKSSDGIPGEHNTTAPLPLSEMTPELKDILINAHVIL